jgi:hypothetical protein
MAQQKIEAHVSANSTNPCTTVPKPARRGIRLCRPFAEIGVISLNFLVDIAE